MLIYRIKLYFKYALQIILLSFYSIQNFILFLSKRQHNHIIIFQIVHIIYIYIKMSNFLKYTLKKEEKVPPKVHDTSKSYKSVNMFMSTNKSQSKWNLDEVIDKSCTTVNQLTDLEKSILKILENKYKTEKILTQDLFQFTVELITSQYMNHSIQNTKSTGQFKKRASSKDVIKKQNQNQTLHQIQLIIGRILSTELKEIKNFVKLFHEKLIKSIKNTQKNKKKQDLKQFEKICLNYKEKKQANKFISENDMPYAKKKYLEIKEGKLKKMKDLSKKSLGTLGSKQGNSSSRNNKSTNKGSIQQNGSLFKLLNKEVQEKKIKEQKYDYSAIMSGSMMNIRKRGNQQNKQIVTPISKTQQKTKDAKDEGFVFFRPKKGTLPQKKK